MFETILLAYNGTREGKSALLTCTEIASLAKMDTHLHLLAIATMPATVFPSEGFVSAEVFEAREKHAQEVLDEGAGQLKEMGFRVTAHLAVGEPVEEICRLATELKAKLIVVGHKQRTSFAARWWRGSVGKALLDNAPCSIFVARTRE